MPKLSKRVVDGSTAKAGRFMVWDAEIKGLGLLVLPSGVKSYVYQYRTPEGRKRRVTIGQHGAWTPDQARRKAEDHRQTVRAGGDPLGAAQAFRNAVTVNDVLDAYLASEDFADKAPVTQAIDRGRIERHLRPLLGIKHAHLITEQDVLRARAAIRDGKTAVDVKTGPRGRARVRGGEGAARMAIIVLGVIFNWAIRSRMMKGESPCRFVKTGSSGTRETILDGAGDYARLFQTLARMEGEGRLRSAVAGAIRLIALTGCRRGEVAGLRWSYVDLKRGLVTLPPASHKAGKRTGKPRVIGLPTAAQAVIARQPAGGRDDFVFAPTKGDGALSLSKAWARVRLEAELPEGIGLHGLRHSLASHMAMAGAGSSEIMTALGHSALATSQKYIHWAKDARQSLAERAASVALAGLAASRGEAKAEVVKLRGKRP
jgi:integrase